MACSSSLHSTDHGSTPPTSTSGRPKPNFLSLPAEVRNDIYAYLLSADFHNYRDSEGHTHYPLATAILYTNKLVYSEAIKILYSKNLFISIETPWRQAEDHVHNEGKVNICARNEAARSFPAQINVMIGMPDVPEANNKIMTNFVIFANELPAFCRIWHYSDLTHLGLNSNLSLHVEVNPSSYVHPSTQRRILPPFGLIKSLHSFSCANLDPNAEKELRAAMAVPYATPEACIEACEKAMSDGFAATRAGAFRAALEHFFRAFHSIHIVVKDRERRIWADAYFEVELAGGAHDGEHGGIVRMVLRLKLVAGIVNTYVALGEYEEAAFWGRRSVSLMREALGNRAEVPSAGFPAAEEWGRILLKTAVACAELGDRDEARGLFRTARRWLQGEEEEEARRGMEI